MLNVPKPTLAVVTVLVSSGSFSADAQTVGPVIRPTSVHVTVLSTMLAEARGIGEWGFAAFLEVDGRRFLIDSGARPETVLRNSEELGVDLSTVTDVVLTHHHGDHTGGLVVLRRELAKKNPQALRTTHVAPGIFAVRVDSSGREGDGLLLLRRAYESLGGSFVEHSKPAELAPGVWFTGPVPRRHPERNWGGDLRVRTPTGLVEDIIDEDASIVVETAAGFVVITGCGHAGIVNILEYIRDFRPSSAVYAVLGGLHLFSATDEHLDWTGAKLRQFGIKHLLGAHCTGIEALFRLRSRLELTRQTAVVAAVGASFSLDRGIDPLSLAR
jgi:7,8-dihydropterin-6-yl-methyl-4-(beta-D-ribofuranosyl)aminobenzene 5'-phosphate synthase